MKRITPLLLVAVAGSVQAGQENLLNPLAMMNPMAGFNAPFAGYGNPMGNPFGGGFGGGNSLVNLNTLSALASLGMLAAPVIAPLAPGLLNPMGQMGYPAMQMAPNMMSYGHYSQYGGSPFGGNPYMQRSLPNPMAPPAFSPSMPTMPFSPSQGTLPLPFGAPSQAAMPNLPFMASPPRQSPAWGVPQSPFGAPAQQAMPNLPFMAGSPQLPFGIPGLTSLIGPSPLPMQGLIPDLTPGMPAMAAPQATGTPWSQAPAPAPAQSVGNPWMMMMVPVPPAAATPAATPAPVAAAPEAANVPLDPATFMQMFMKPVAKPAEAAAPPAAK